MRQTTPEQIRGIQSRSILAFDTRESRRGRDSDKKQADKIPVHTSDIRFHAASAGATDVFSSQHFDVLLRDTPAKSNNWAVWWSDLMMTMFIMFAALYAFQMPKDTLPPKLVQVPLPQHEDPEPPEPVMSDSILERTFVATREAVQQGGLGDVISVRLVPEKVLRISIDGDVLFEGSTSTLKPSASRSIHVLAGALAKAPYKITVVGHTDGTPTSSPAFASNWELSTARACSVGRSLILEGGIAQDRLIMTGLGDQQPLQPNDSPANKALNRRVELVLSVENPTDALAEEKIATSTKENVRHWLVSGSGQGEGKWKEKH